jgi:hypothetical protein
MSPSLPAPAKCSSSWPEGSGSGAVACHFAAGWWC